MVEYGLKIEEEVKAMKTEIKENVQGTNSDRKEIRTQVNSLEQKEEINIQLEQNEETRMQKKKKEFYKPLGQPEMLQYSNYRGARRRRTTARN